MDLQHWIVAVALARADHRAAGENFQLARAAMHNRDIDLRRAEEALKAAIEEEVKHAA